MSKYKNKNDFTYEHTIISGNSLDLEVDYCESEIRADIVVSEHSSVRLWGRVINCEGDPVKDALIKLLQVENYKGSRPKYTGVAHTISDCEGFYQFELSPCLNEDSSSYRVLVSKSAYGPERIIPINKTNCSPCEDDSDCYVQYHSVKGKNDKKIRPSFDFE
ncbi:MAG: hypothetical protein R3Y64_00195 [Peptostreptococcaceae bacterium]